MSVFDASLWRSLFWYMMCFLCCLGEFVRLAELPCLVDLVFVGNPLEERHSADGTWMDEACKRLPNLKKLDGKSADRYSN